MPATPTHPPATKGRDPAVTTPTVDPPTVPNLRPPGSTLRIPARPPWVGLLWRAVTSTGATVTMVAAILVGLTLIGAGFL